MSKKHIGKQTVELENPPIITNTFSMVGYKEGEGPLANTFDVVLEKDAYSDLTWEKAESAIQVQAINGLIEKSGYSNDDIDYLFGGDLLNQCAGTHYGMRDTNIPFVGLYGACSTMSLGLSIAAMTIDGGFADKTIAITSSHFCSAEKQYRFPMEYGGQRPQSAQWTVTGSGCVMLESEGDGPCVTHITTGKILDMGVTDANNMGAAMAPAFCDTMNQHFKDTGRTPDYYDLILSGDLGLVGKKMAIEMLKNEYGLDFSKGYNDCGAMIFDIKEQDVHSGGSGCGCSASVLCGYVYKMMREKQLNKVLFCSTGALLSPTSLLQKESIPAIAHAVAIEN